MKNVEDISVEALKSNDYYVKKLDEAKKLVKQKVFSMSTKEEQLNYVEEEKTRYKLLKENNNGLLVTALIVSIISLITIILLGVLKENIVFLILWIVGIVILLGSIITFFIINYNHSKIKYSIMIMAYEEVEGKIRGNAGAGFENDQLKKSLDAINREVELVQDQLKLIYGLQKEINNRKQK